MKRICVYCGSSQGARQEYSQAAVKLGKALVDNNIELVYGGASVGLMGQLADTVIDLGGRVIGVIPHHLKKEVAHYGISELHEVDSMHERKQMMIDLSDAMIAMPGGFGTFEEIFEAVTWGQLQLHEKPCGLLNVANYYDKLLHFLDHAVKEKFLRPEHRQIMISSSNPQRLLKKLNDFKPETVRKWI